MKTNFKKLNDFDLINITCGTSCCNDSLDEIISKVDWLDLKSIIKFILFLKQKGYSNESIKKILKKACPPDIFSILKYQLYL